MMHIIFSQEISSSASLAPSKLLQVISPEEVPRLEYSIERCKFLVTPHKLSLLGTPVDKANVFRNRYKQLTI